ncbi:MAG: cytochrome c oxidase subunit II [Verrucomicrobia bacterium]|nr:cytochrome c oxidase subunit II [Verrucomicrobiota bacterium]
MPKFVPSLGRVGRALIALAALVLLSGCEWNFWRMDGHQSTMVVDGPVAREQLRVFYVTCWVTLFIFIVVGSVLAYTMIKFRAKSEADEHAEPPPQSHGNPLIELGLIGASVLALVIIAVPTLKAIWVTYDLPEPERKNAYAVTATGYQWWFKFEYPNEQAAVDNTGTKAPLVTGNELVIPAGRPVRINLRTVDVIHSFWVPKLAGKVDMIPNRANVIWLQADQPGYFWGQCAEYCGDSHAVMRFRVIALAEKDFAEWRDRQLAVARAVAATAADAARPRTQVTALRAFHRNEVGVTAKFDQNPLEAWRAKQQPAGNEDAALIAQGRQLFTTKTCNACHTVRGHGAMGVQGPDLTHMGSRTTIAAGLIENNSEQLRRWIRDPESVKPGNKMAKAYRENKISLNDEEQVAIVAYLESLK